MRRLLSARFQVLKNLEARFSQTLFVVGSPRVGGGDIGTCPFEGALGQGSTLSQHSCEGLMDQHCVQEIKDRQEDRCRYGSEQ
jgi:hypothetical protein